MSKDSVTYYQAPSSAGKEILDLFLKPDDYKEDCIHTIWHLERNKGFSFNMLNAVKYLWRLGKKDDSIKELEKAIDYLGWELDYVSELPRPDDDREWFLDLALLRTGIGKCMDLAIKKIKKIGSHESISQ